MKLKKVVFWVTFIISVAVLWIVFGFAPPVHWWVILLIPGGLCAMAAGIIADKMEGEYLSPIAGISELIYLAIVLVLIL